MDQINQLIAQLSRPQQNSPYPAIGISDFATPSRKEDIAMNILPMGRVAKIPGVSRMSPQVIKRAAQLLSAGGKVHPQDIDEIGKFAEMVEMGKKGNMGETGKTIQALIENLFGKKAASMSNRQAKDVLDQVLQRAMGGMNG